MDRNPASEYILYGFHSAIPPCSAARPIRASPLINTTLAANQNRRDRRRVKGRTVAVIPCLNAAETLGAVIDGVRPYVAQVIVVDDGSQDDTANIARDAGCIVVRHLRNEGKGAALVTGLAEAQAGGFTHVVALDADGQHPPDNLPRLMEEALAHPEALIIGARDFRDQPVPGASRFGRRFSNFWVWLETGLRLNDTQSGLRVYPVREILDLRVSPSRFEWEVEVIVRAAWAGRSVREIDVSVFYPPPSERRTHYRKVEDSLLISLLHVQLILQGLVRTLLRVRTRSTRISHEL